MCVLRGGYCDVTHCQRVFETAGGAENLKEGGEKEGARLKTGEEGNDAEEEAPGDCVCICV